MIKNYAWWSDIGEIRLPAIQPSFITLLKMLSIKVWLRLVNLVGEVMFGRRLVEYMMSTKSETFLSESHFGRSILNSLCCMHGCLYMHPTTMFFFLKVEFRSLIVKYLVMLFSELTA